MATDDDEVERLAAENDRLRTELERAEAQRAEAERSAAELSDGAREQRSGRVRSATSVVMAVLGCVLLVVAVLGVWVRSIVLDTQRYVDTVAPLAENTEVRDALADRIATTITDAIDVEGLASEVLPERASILAAPIASGAENLVRSAADRVVSSDQFETVWLEANTAAHDALVAAITGRDDGAVALSDGQVVLRLGPLVERALELLDEQFGTDISSRVPADSIDTQWVLVDSAQFASVQDGVRLMDAAAWVAAAVTLLLLVGSVLVAPDRRRGVLRVGAAVALAMLAVVLAMSLGRDALLSNLPDTVRHPAALAAVFDIVTRFVLRAVRLGFVLGVVLALGAWLVGPGSVPTRVRQVATNLLGQGSEAAAGVTGLGPVPGWVASNLRGLRVAVVALAGVALVVWDRPTGKAVLLLALIVLVALGVLQLLAGMAGRGAAGADQVGTDSAGSDAAGAEPAGSGLTGGDDDVGIRQGAP